jgi:hypothetical protein
VADLIRSIALALGGVAFGLAIAEALVYRARYTDKNDAWYQQKRLLSIIYIRIGIAIAVVMMTAVVATRLGDGGLTFRTPGAITAEIFLIWGMSGTLNDEVGRAKDPVVFPSRRRNRRKTDKLG